MPGAAEVRQGCFDSLTLFAKAKRVQSLQHDGGYNEWFTEERTLEKFLRPVSVGKYQL